MGTTREEIENIFHQMDGGLQDLLFQSTCRFGCYKAEIDKIIH